MVSRRNFISITIMMLTLLMMFQLTQAYYENIAEIDKNEFVSEQVISGANAWKPEVVDLTDPELETRYLLFFGEESGAVGHAVKQWCTYTKRNLVVCQDLNSFSGKVGKNQEYVLVESSCLDFENDLNTLGEFAEAGVSIVFCDLPDVAEISKNARLQQMLGIRTVADEQVTAEGIKLFSGFLVGGEVSYYADDEVSGLTKEDLEMPWYQLNAGAQTYMVGLLDEQSKNDESVTRENLPALIWSYSDGKSKIFAVNGDYLHGNTGVGILSAMDAKMSDYALYPILDAQLLTVANYPSLTNENVKVMYEVFSSGMVQAGRDIVFPQMVATAEQTDFVMSCMLQMQNDYGDFVGPEVAAFQSYLKLMKKAEAEMGLSLDRFSETSLREKLQKDLRFMETANSKYRYGAVYSTCDSFADIVGVDALPDSVNTVVSAQYADQDLISFGNDRITVQTITGDASEHNFRSDLYMRSVQTSLGYTNVLLDLNKVFWPSENDPSWEVLSKRYADNLYTDWRNFQSFEDVTVSRNDQKIRNLLIMDYDHVRKENVIYLELENTDEAVSFVLRLHHMEPEYVAGATCVALEDGAYLIRATARNVEIHLTNSNPIHN